MPNPFSNTTIIKYFIPKNEDYANLMIFDIGGRMIQSHELDLGEEASFEISLEDFPSGVYSYAVFTKKGFTAKQMIHKK